MCVCVCVCVCVCMSQLKSSSNTPESDRPQHYLPSAQCYRPAVFFRPLLLIAPSFPHGKFQRAFQAIYYFIP